jgi:4-hydroxy-3-polyprenylbenzoate decarboxylase
MTLAGKNALPRSRAKTAPVADSMRYTDLREWLAIVDRLGELVQIGGAHWDLEIGALTEIIRRQSPVPPAILFDKIVDHQPGYRVLTGMLNTVRRLALVTGLPSDITDAEFVDRWRSRLRDITPLPPRVVTSGPVLENVFEEKDADFNKFPSPRWHKLDGGRYIGTATLAFTRDPDTGRVNMGTYRVMVAEDGRLAVYISPGKHGRINRDKFFERGKPCPITLSFGHDPAIFLAGPLNLRYGVSELEYAGGIKGEPVEVLEGRSTGLPILAFSELAVEGEIVPDETVPEGPFAEFLGYYASGRKPEYVMRIHRLLHRNDPIVCGMPPGRPPQDATFSQARMRSSVLWNALEDAGVTDIRGVCCHEVGAGVLFNVVSVRQRYAGHARQAAVLASQLPGGAYLSRFIIVVDEDIDPFNLEEVVWAMGTRCDPERDIDIARNCWSSPLDPLVQHGQPPFNSRAIVDATKPFAWKDQFPATAELDPEVRERVTSKWGDLIAGLARPHRH